MSAVFHIESNRVAPHGTGRPRAEDLQTRVLDRPLVRVRDHSGVRDRGHFWQVMGGHESLDHRQHRRGLGLVARERVHYQREDASVSSPIVICSSSRRSLENPGSRITGALLPNGVVSRSRSHRDQRAPLFRQVRIPRRD
jgi:hypothetical protein